MEDNPACSSNLGTVCDSLESMEVNFLDVDQVCCDICGAIVQYEQLAFDHINHTHPQLTDQLQQDVLQSRVMKMRESMHAGFKQCKVVSRKSETSRGKGINRKPTLRINPHMLTISQLNQALHTKITANMGAKMPVSLVSRTHARCGLCSTIISMNRKFEVFNIVRHFRSWHSLKHVCSGQWINKSPSVPKPKPLSLHDFTVVKTVSHIANNLQCIWCADYFDSHSIAAHFSTAHPEEISIPNCNLCIQELVLNARFNEQYGEEMNIRMSSEFHIISETYDTSAATEEGLNIRLKEIKSGKQATNSKACETLTPTITYSNSALVLGKTKRRKKRLVNPCLRQFPINNSPYINCIDEGHWQCKLCGKHLMAAVISATFIMHFKRNHLSELCAVQVEICGGRLEKVSDGSMELVDSRTVECLICNTQHVLHKEYNLCRAIRHLKNKHASLMPEYSKLCNLPRENQTESPAPQIHQLTEDTTNLSDEFPLPSDISLTDCSFGSLNCLQPMPEPLTQD